MARRIEFEVIVDSEGAVTALKQVANEAEEAGEQVEEMGEKGAASTADLGKQFAALKTAFTGVAGGIAAVAAAITAAAAGAALAVGKLTVEVVELAGEADALAKLASTLGTTAEELQVVVGALGLGGATADIAQQAIRDLNLRLGDAALNGGAAAAALDRLGLTAGELERLPLAERFAVIADRLGTMESQSLKTRTAADLMGESGVRLLSAFEGGGEVFRDAADAIREAGIISDRTAEQSEALIDSVSLMSASFRSLKTEALAPLIPTVAAIADQLAKLFQHIRDNGSFASFGKAVEEALVDRAIPAITGFGALAVAAFAEVEARADKLRASVRLVAAASTGNIRDMQVALVELQTAAVDTDEVTATILRFARSMATAQDEVRETIQVFREMGSAQDEVVRQVEEGTGAIEEQAEALRNVAEAASFASEVQREQVGIQHDVVIAGLQAIAEAREAAREQERRAQEAERERAQEVSRSAVSSALSVLSIISRAEREALAVRVRQEEEASDRVQSIRDQLADATTERTRKRLRQELDAAIKSERIAEEGARQAFARGKALSLAQATISTAQAVAGALAQPPYPPGTIPAAIAAGALGAVQIAAIASEPAPSFHSGGLLRDEMMITARRGEAVLSPAAVESVGGEAGIRALNAGANTGPTTLIVEQKVRTRVLDSQVYDLGRSGQGALQRQILRGQPRPGSHRPTGMG